MSRYKMVQTPQRIPGNCMTCGKGECRQGFVDTEMTLDGYGAVQICYDCIRGMSEAFGIDAMARNIISEDAVAQVNALHGQLETIREGLSNSIDSVAVRVGNLGNHFAKCERLISEATQGRSDRTSGGASRNKGGKNRISESSSVEQLGDSDGSSAIDF